MITRVSMLGLGKLGLCLAACFAYKGITTVGIDIEEHIANSVNNRVSPILEPGLQELIGQVGGRTLRAGTDPRTAIEESDITFILVPTPSNPDGTFSNRFVESALRSLGDAYAEIDKEYHVFVISSTVMPMSTESKFVPLIEKHSGKKLNKDFGVCYDPDFVALGDVIKGFLRPDLIVIGESESKAGIMVEQLHRHICENKPYVSRMSLVSAEIAKMSLNAYITVKISFANTLANICELVPGADVDAITRTIGADRRISPHFFSGGLSFGGACFPRDTKQFVSFASRYGNEAHLIRAVDKVNTFQDEHLLEVVLRHVKTLKNQRVGVLGLAFKPNTPVITESPAIKLIGGLVRNDVEVIAYDPLATENARVLFEDSIEFCSSAEDCLKNSGLCVITTPAEEFKQAAEAHVPQAPLILLDCWRLLDAEKLGDRVKCVSWGYPGDGQGAAGA